MIRFTLLGSIGLQRPDGTPVDSLLRPPKRQALGEAAILTRGDEEVAINPTRRGTELGDLHAALGAGDAATALKQYGAGSAELTYEVTRAGQDDGGGG